MITEADIQAAASYAAVVIGMAGGSDDQQIAFQRQMHDLQLDPDATYNLYETIHEAAQAQEEEIRIQSAISHAFILGVLAGRSECARTIIPPIAGMIIVDQEILKLLRERKEEEEDG